VTGRLTSRMRRESGTVGIPGTHDLISMGKMAARLRRNRHLHLIPASCLLVISLVWALTGIHADAGLWPDAACCARYASPGIIERAVVTEVNDSEADSRRRQRAAELRALERELLFAHPLVGVDFLLPGEQLGIGCQGLACLPLSSCERLILKTHGTLIRVDGPDQLVGHVQIRSTEMALRYARLFTSPATVYILPQPWWLEVVPVTAVDRQFVFGITTWVDSLRRVSASGSEYRDYGILTGTQWRQSNLQRPEVKRIRDGFVVTRSLFRLYSKPHEASTHNVYVVAETVSRDGKIRKQALRKVRLGLQLGFKTGWY